MRFEVYHMVRCPKCKSEIFIAGPTCPFDGTPLPGAPASPPAAQPYTPPPLPAYSPNPLPNESLGDRTLGSKLPDDGELNIELGGRRSRRRASLSDLEGGDLPKSRRESSTPPAEPRMEFRAPGPAGSRSRRRYDEILTGPGERETMQDWSWSGIYATLTDPSRRAPQNRNLTAIAGVRGDVGAVPGLAVAGGGAPGPLDIAFLDEFAREFFPVEIRGGRWTQTVYCTTLEEFVGHLVGDQEASETIRRLRAQAERQQAVDSAEHGGFVMGINMPGRGCFINGWAFARMAGHDDARAALQDTRTRNLIAATVMHEKYGHGFIDALTPVGDELTQLKSTQYYLAEVFPGKAFDTPDAALYNEKWNLALNSMLFLQEGYSYWIAKRAVEQLTQMGRLDGGAAVPPDYTEPAVFAALERAGGSELSGAMRLLLDEEADTNQTLDAVRRLNAMGPKAEQLFAGQLGRTPRYVLGYILCKRIEDRWGPACVPQAVLIAANFKLNLASISNADLKRLLETQPNLSGDARFAVIADLPAGPRNNLQALAKVCHENLNLSVPGGAPARGGGGHAGSAGAPDTAQQRSEFRPMPLTPGQPTAGDPTYVQPTPVASTPISTGQFQPMTLRDGAAGEWRCASCNYLNVGTRSTTCLNCGHTMRDMVQTQAPAPRGVAYGSGPTSTITQADYGGAAVHCSGNCGWVGYAIQHPVGSACPVCAKPVAAG